MSKRNKCPKTGAVWKMTSTEATLAKKPLYNGYACSHGVHGDVKYNRAKQKRMTQKFLGEQGASRGSFSYVYRSSSLEISNGVGSYVSF